MNSKIVNIHIKLSKKMHLTLILPIFICPEKCYLLITSAACTYIQMHSRVQTNFTMESNAMDPDQTALLTALLRAV